jgi:hypothetical protein
MGSKMGAGPEMAIRLFQGWPTAVSRVVGHGGESMYTP